ncbi:MAG: ATP-binding protein [Cyanobacteria bacterium P01_F01_bin.53]
MSRPTDSLPAENPSAETATTIGDTDTSARIETMEKELKSLLRSNRILRKQLDRSQRTRKEMEIDSQQRENILRQARQAAEAESLKLAAAKAELTQLNLQLENRLEVGNMALSKAESSLNQAKVQVVKSEKFSTLGELVAGVAHEINNPISCITNNVKFVKEYSQQLLEHIALQQAVLSEHESSLPPTELTKIQAKAQEIDLHYISEDFPNLIESMVTSGDRIKAISQSLRTFARADTTKKQAYNLHEGIDGTLLILRHRLKATGNQPAITVHTHYGNIPLIQCYPGQINQVFMNILANAIDAIEEDVLKEDAWEEGTAPSGAPEIDITTAIENDRVIITLQDNAGGMPEHVRSHIFESQFTTKSAGKGTGLGLSIAHQIVTETHQGLINCQSTLGQGSTFTISLPIEEEQQQLETAD